MAVFKKKRSCKLTPLKVSPLNEALFLEAKK